MREKKQMGMAAKLLIFFVIACVGIFTISKAIPAFSGMKQNRVESEMKMDLSLARNAIENYKYNKHELPERLENIDKRVISEDFTYKYNNTGEYIISKPYSKNGITYYIKIDQDGRITDKLTKVPEA